MFFRGPWVLAFQTMTLWYDDDIENNVTGSSKQELMFVNIRSIRMFVFLVCFLITCLRLQCFIKHLGLKPLLVGLKSLGTHESCIRVFSS